jgi:putative NADH-flavin reductase
MPVIVIGADTEYGLAVTEGLTHRNGEVRAFVTDPDSVPLLRAAGVKVAIGDISDASHIEGAAHQAFSAVLMAQAAVDDRERSFATSPEAVWSAWAAGLRDAGVQRLIWVGPDGGPPPTIPSTSSEWATVDVRGRSSQQVAAEVVRLDDLAELDSE